MPDKNMWMVRAGQGAFAVQYFRSKGLVAIAWSGRGTDWTKYRDRDAIQ